MIPANNWPDYLRTQHDVKQLAAEAARSRNLADESSTLLVSGDKILVIDKSGQLEMDEEMTEVFLGAIN